MGYLSSEEVSEFLNGNGKEMKAGNTYKLIPLRYEPFFYGPLKDKKMPKHILMNVETNEEVEGVGFKFHDAIGLLNDAIVPEVTVLDVQCLDNGTKYPDFLIEVASGGVKTEATAPVVDKELGF